MRTDLNSVREGGIGKILKHKKKDQIQLVGKNKTEESYIGLVGVMNRVSATFLSRPCSWMDRFEWCRYVRSWPRSGSNWTVKTIKLKQHVKFSMLKQFLF